LVCWSLDREGGQTASLRSLVFDTGKSTLPPPPAAHTGTGVPCPPPGRMSVAGPLPAQRRQGVRNPPDVAQAFAPFQPFPWKNHPNTGSSKSSFFLSGFRPKKNDSVQDFIHDRFSSFSASFSYNRGLPSSFSSSVRRGHSLLRTPRKRTPTSPSVRPRKSYLALECEGLRGRFMSNGPTCAYNTLNGTQNMKCTKHTTLTTQKTTTNTST